MSKIKLLIADDIEETRNVIKKILDMEKELFEIVGEACNGEETIDLIPEVKPDVVLMDINMPILNGLEATERITNEFPGVIVIIMSVQAENEYLKKAMLHGAKEYIIKPFNYDSLVSTIKSTYDLYKDRLSKQIATNSGNKNAKNVVFFSSKGGVGKSIIALNTAITLGKHSESKCLLLDMDLQFGDISMLVNDYTSKTILDVVDDCQLDSYDNIKPYLYNYNESLDILFAPRKPEAAEFIGKDSIEKMMKIFQRYYDFIIIDTGINFNDGTLYLLDTAEKIMFITTMEIVALKNTKLGVSVMQSLGYDNNKVNLIINKFNTEYGITKNEVEEAFKEKMFAVIPSDERTVSISVNKGQPFSSSLKCHKLKINKAVEGMCKELLDTTK